MNRAGSGFQLAFLFVFVCSLDWSLAFKCITKINKTLLENQICDGVVDCLGDENSDQPDERFELCYSKVCEDESFYRCTYGGCLNGTLKCDGKIDCWDGSDENKFECLEDANLQNEYEDLKGGCVDEDLFDCKGSCLNWSQVCDGLADCKDGSDEDPTLCTAFECPPPAFRCLYGACVSPKAVCNHIPDCLDGSDEMAEICMARNPSVDHLGQDVKNGWKVRHCRLENPSGSLVVENYVGGTTFLRNALVPDKTVVHLSCRNGYGLIGDEKNICDADQWRYPLASCVPQCKHVGKLSHTRQCILPTGPIDCDQSWLPMLTLMSVTCSSGYEKTGDDGWQFCNKTGGWVIFGNNELPTCEPICGVWKLKNATASSSPPWLMNVFQRGHKPEFTAVCIATIVSPYILVTTERCFGEVSIKSVASTEPVLYTVAEGEIYGNSFLAHEPHPYKLHNVSYIHYVRVSDGKNAGTLALVHLVQPLEFHMKLRPVCLTEEVTDNWVTVGNFKGVRAGQPNIDDRRQPDRHELKEVIIDERMKYHISVFKQDILNDIAETHAKENI
ncbi:modular serine protease-like [Drosophila santomea]|uniref:modular serine protease-like n=1 Tax=Drosophila santomea TaxID=129105 RepID=UPI0019544F5D|nr:modular serine protease-like [Drosophila santomea]